MALAKKEPSAALLQNIKRQVEFYFGDANMTRDAFLKRQTKLDEGWVPMNIMLRFRLLASMSRDVEVILEALKDSDLIEISADRTKIRRFVSRPLARDDAEYSKREQKARTVYVEGFSRDADIKSLIEHLETTYPVEYVFLKKDKTGYDLLNAYEFNGSLFLQFKTLDDAKKFMAEPATKYKNNILTKTWAPDSYCIRDYGDKF